MTAGLVFSSGSALIERRYNCPVRFFHTFSALGETALTPPVGDGPLSRAAGGGMGGEGRFPLPTACYHGLRACARYAGWPRPAERQIGRWRSNLRRKRCADSAKREALFRFGNTAFNHYPLPRFIDGDELLC